MKKNRLRIAIQKSGRLNNDCLDLLSRCGIKIHLSKNSLFCHCENLPIDILFVRDDDIPNLIIDEVCDCGIVGENILFEKTLTNKYSELEDSIKVIKKLGFSQCRLSIAVPIATDFTGPLSLNGLRIATTYPQTLSYYLSQHKVVAKITTISGSVEIAPRLGMADAICDLVATGRTLEENNLKEVDCILQSQAVLIGTNNILSAVQNSKAEIFELILRRINGVIKAQESKYIMFHAPRSSLPIISTILPGCETPTIMPLEGTTDKIAVHVVSTEGVFWGTLEKLQQIGASSILVLPIEKMLN